MTQNKGATFESDAGSKRATIAEGYVEVRAIVATTDNGAAILLDLYHFDGIKERRIAAVNVPADSGLMVAAPSVDVLNSADLPWTEVDERGNRVIRLAEGETLRVAVATAPAVGKRLDVVAFAWVLS